MKNLVNQLQVTEDTKLNRGICGVCVAQEIRYCSTLRYKRKGKWYEMLVCTECIPINEKIQLSNNRVVVKMELLEILLKMNKLLTNIVLKQGLDIYARKKKVKKAVKIGFEEIEDKSKKNSRKVGSKEK